MRKKYALTVTVLSLCSAVFLGYYLVNNLTENEILINENASDIKTESSENLNYAYIIKEYDGKVAVFIKNSDTPDIIFDVYVHQLPKYDETQLREGIFVENYEKLISLIEDYTT